LISEDENVGKGADTTISLVHHYFEKHSLGEKRVIIHADNCTGQNKNNAMIMYLAWRIANNLHEKITYSFMVAGHTKFTPDGFFGLLKLKLRHSEVDDIWDLVNVVKESTTGGYNIAQTILNSDGQREVFFYGWTEFLINYFNTVPQIKKQHHFILSRDNIGYVEVKTAVNEGTQLINLTKKGHGISYLTFPKEIIPKGITPERQWYLYEEVRQHVQDPSKYNSYCPLPSVAKPKIQKKKIS
jgi:hypothetical protein